MLRSSVVIGDVNELGRVYVSSLRLRMLLAYVSEAYERRFDWTIKFDWPITES